MVGRKSLALAIALAVALGTGTTTPATATADTVRVPLGQQGQGSIARPPHGTNKTQVEAVYGEPQEKRGPTGNPPIYVWEYPDFTVYFEGNLVLHSVLKHQPKNDK